MNDQKNISINEAIKQFPQEFNNRIGFELNRINTNLRFSHFEEQRGNMFFLMSNLNV
ncbi:hypothetical protein DDB_G0282015 [Dictyostelium discoideum AX4]|uniref:Putative uncharacterized protein DDB_G0282015 n=1 Tax=Dictyostelium discoideum TaxID=44689 RepID=Y5088_DICDI|nr:hypothetical protein DDB_G0282015 [Dictyostelium discoideum AX4]Q54T43.1 RecName: Full=Putative uncharacterized protein DDB_G0282015 [Dictyostelium discoideum]EAL66429.1 hypothetical protein DDB_G0282015 [Dictyostelium discoideum AX4]|eukprot:XP_640408.1 hypothetical protein DDB_G0282015 [Dictyostelium discoideum AX4]